MNLNNVITGSPVTSGELRAARDQRVLKKLELLTPGGEICLVDPPFPKSINDVGFFSKENLNSK